MREPTSFLSHLATHKDQLAVVTDSLTLGYGELLGRVNDGATQHGENGFEPLDSFLGDREKIL